MAEESMRSISSRVLRLIAFCLGVLVQGLAGADTPCRSAETGSYSHPSFTPVNFEVMHPCTTSNGKLAVFVFYFALSDMDYYFGKNLSDGPSTPTDSKLYLYKSIANALAQAGYTVLRYNALGVGCRGTDVSTIDNPYCIRSSETLRVRISDFSDVLNGVIQAAASHVPESNRRMVVLIGHSAASMVASNYLSDQFMSGANLKNFGFVGIAPVLSSGRESVKHQRANYWTTKLAACPRSEFDRCAKAVLSSDWASALIDERDRSFILDSVSAGKLKALPRIEKRLSESAKARMHADLHPDPNKRVISIEYKTPLHVDLETTHAIIYGDAEHGKNIVKLPAVSFVFGGDDLAVSAPVQMATWKRLGGSETDGQTLPGSGHALGQDVFWGPPEQRGFDAIIDAVDRVAKKLDAASLRKP